MGPFKRIYSRGKSRRAPFNEKQEVHCMRKSMKKFFSLVLAVTLCLAFSVTAFARYITEPTFRNNLSISGSQATMYSSVTADSSVTKIVITQVLQKDGKDVPGTSKSETFYKSSASKQNTVTCSGSGAYQVKTTYKITSPDGTDTHTKYSNTVNK